MVDQHCSGLLFLLSPVGKRQNKRKTFNIMFAFSTKIVPLFVSVTFVQTNLHFTLDKAHNYTTIP